MTQQKTTVEDVLEVSGGEHTEAPRAGKPRATKGATAAFVAAILGQAWLVGVTILTRLAVEGTNADRRLADRLFPYTMALFIISVVSNCLAMSLGKDAIRAARRDPAAHGGVGRAAIAVIVGTLGVIAMMLRLLWARFSV